MQTEGLLQSNSDFPLFACNNGVGQVYIASKEVHWQLGHLEDVQVHFVALTVHILSISRLLYSHLMQGQWDM